MVDVLNSSSLSSLTQAERDKNAQNAKLLALLDEFDVEVQARANRLRVQATQELKMSLMNQLHLELVKVPQRIRTMTMKEFCEKYNGDINQVYQKEIENLAASIQFTGAIKKRKENPIPASDAKNAKIKTTH
eukprot:TRINITY_DN25561_c0_g1_i1.p1 TRINITY_DN25561_c0_g1~~TRINITY_DN25561_c0_g1_i1.p1  ORF type:complete len:132 (+),score=36.28 TRINITY_DN25561_c0_g1_i1:127-522(+)